MVLLGNRETAITFVLTIFCQAESRNLQVALTMCPHQDLKVGTDGIVPKVSRFERTQQQARTAVIQDQLEQEERQRLLHIQQAVDHGHGSLFAHDLCFFDTLGSIISRLW